MPSPDVPLLTQVVPGFRAWDLRDDGTLWPAAVGDRPWDPGVNVARCANRSDHEAPGESCACGLYAFHTIHRQLGGEPLVGGIAAWGAMEVHRDGFRAARAMVLALARGRGTRPLVLERAADRYGVPIVERSDLEAFVALRTGSLPASLLGLDDAWLERRRGHDPGNQLWVEASQGFVTIGMSRHLHGWLGDGPRQIDVRERSLTVRGADMTVYLPRSVRGEVVAVNDDHTALWLVRLRPTAWGEDCRQFDWGAVGAADTDLRAAREGPAAIAHLRDAAPQQVTSWRDVLAELRARRDAAAAPRFGTESDVYDEVAIPLGQALARDRTVRQRLTRLGVVVGLDVREPGARIVLDLRPGQGVLFCGPRGPAPDLEVGLTADDLVRVLGARLDLAQAARARQIDVRSDLAATLSALAVLGSWARDHVSQAATVSA